MLPTDMKMLHISTSTDKGAVHELISFLFYIANYNTL